MLIKGMTPRERSVCACFCLCYTITIRDYILWSRFTKTQETHWGYRNFKFCSNAFYSRHCIPSPWQANILPNEQRTLEILVLTDTPKAKRDTMTSDSGSSTKALAGANSKAHSGANSWPLSGEKRLLPTLSPFKVIQ